MATICDGICGPGSSTNYEACGKSGITDLCSSSAPTDVLFILSDFFVEILNA